MGEEGHQEEYEALAQRHGDTIQRTPTPLMEKCRHGHQMQQRS